MKPGGPGSVRYAGTMRQLLPAPGVLRGNLDVRAAKCEAVRPFFTRRGVGPGRLAFVKFKLFHISQDFPPAAWAGGKFCVLYKNGGVLSWNLSKRSPCRTGRSPWRNTAPNAWTCPSFWAIAPPVPTMGGRGPVPPLTSIPRPSGTGMTGSCCGR